MTLPTIQHNSRGLVRRIGDRVIELTPRGLLIRGVSQPKSRAVLVSWEVIDSAAVRRESSRAAAFRQPLPVSWSPQAGESVWLDSQTSKLPSRGTVAHEQQEDLFDPTLVTIRLERAGCVWIIRTPLDRLRPAPWTAAVAENTPAPCST